MVKRALSQEMKKRIGRPKKLWALEKLERLITRKGGLVDCHRHLASERILDRKKYAAIVSGLPLSGKWGFMDAIKQEPFYLEILYDRVNQAIFQMWSQGIRACRTYAEVDSTVGFKVLDCMLELKKEWQKEGFYLQVAAYPFKGVVDSKEYKLAYEGCKKADLLGCLPSRGRGSEYDHDTSHKNMQILFQIAKDNHRPIDLQVDQDNDPEEQESYELVRVAEEFRNEGYKQGITATHCISLSAYRRESWNLRDWIIAEMKRLDISVVVCPGASLSMKQRYSKLAPVHNSIAPIPLLLEGGVTVGIGTDNVSDIYMPFTIGDIREEMREMLRAIRWQETLEPIADIMTVNGRKILGMDLNLRSSF